MNTVYLEPGTTPQENEANERAKSVLESAGFSVFIGKRPRRA